MYSRCKILANFRFLGCKVSQCRKSSDISGNNIYGKHFFKEEVQKILRDITVVNREKVFGYAFNSRPLKAPTIEFMTAKQLEEEESKVQERLLTLLQIPPVIDPVEDKLEILDTNKALDGHDLEHSKFVFTDLSEGYINESRLIVVREPDGVLRKAFRNERHRMNEIYFPLSGRKYEMPKMFEEEYLTRLVNRKQYLFVLNHACVQFDPDDPMYHKIINKVYETINGFSEFGFLDSTRHFGALAFYLVIHKKIDNLLIFMISRERLKDAMLLVQLYFIIHPECQSAKKVKDSNKNFLETFIKLDAVEKEKINMALEEYFKKVKYEKDLKEAREAQ